MKRAFIVSCIFEGYRFCGPGTLNDTGLMSQTQNKEPMLLDLTLYGQLIGNASKGEDNFDWYVLRSIKLY